jgi:hypothetical protein
MRLMEMSCIMSKSLCKLAVVDNAGAHSNYGTRQVHRLIRSIGGGRWIIVDIPRGSIDMGIIQ